MPYYLISPANHPERAPRYSFQLNADYKHFKQEQRKAVVLPFRGRSRQWNYAVGLGPSSYYRKTVMNLLRFGGSTKLLKGYGIAALLMLFLWGCSDSPTQAERPDPVDIEPILELSVEQAIGENIYGDQADFHVRIIDDHGLVSAFLQVGQTRYELDVAGKTLKETTITHSFEDTGMQDWRLEARDTADQLSSKDGSVYVVPKWRFELQGRGFWTKKPGFVEQLTLRHVELDEEYTLTPNEQGVFIADLFAGLYVIGDVQGSYYNVSRMLVDRDLYQQPEQFKDDNEFTYLVSGKEGTPWLIDLNKQMSAEVFHIESLDKNVNEYTNQDLLENLSRLAHEDGFIVTPRFWETQTIVINKGNPDYPDDFDYRRDFIANLIPGSNDQDIASLLPGRGRYPPGTRFGKQELNNAREYVKDMKDISSVQLRQFQFLVNCCSTCN